MITLYNTLSKKLETFNPIDKENVKIYTCGPTVYNFAHIGNFTAYIYWDLLIRTLKLNHYKVNRVLNLTDVGHLSSDEDEGEDKLEKGAKREGKNVWEIADSYINAFLQDFKALNLITPSTIARATDYVNADIKLVELLTRKGYTYETSDGIYFDTSKFKNYTDFAKLDIKGLMAGARVNFSSEKRNATDFAIWKFIKPGEKHDMRWDYLGRPGYPGWHLECSTIIHETLGETIDIHAGGIDHIPIHHTNEIAQSEAAFDKKLSNFWLHCDFITIENEKISKSIGNTYTLTDLKEKGFSPLDYKMWVLEGNYRSARNFSFEDLEAAKNRRLSWRNKIAKAKQLPPIDPKSFPEKKFESGLLETVNNNLNSAAAFALIDTLPENAPLKIWKFIDELFGLNLLNSCPEITNDQKDLIEERELSRKNKDYKTSDELRTKLENTGLTIEDTPLGPIWQYLN